MEHTSPGSESSTCPSCEGLFDANLAFCPHCRLKTTGPDVERLTAIRREIGALQSEWREVFERIRREQQQEYDDYLRSRLPTQPTSPFDNLTQFPESHEMPARGVQNTLLWVGASLCAAAALLFVVYAWGRLGLGARVSIMVGIDAAFFAGGYLTWQRNLRSTGESLTTVGMVLALINIGAAYALDFLGAKSLAPETYWAIMLLVYAPALMAYRFKVPMASPGVVALTTIQFPAPLLLAHFGGDTVPTALVLGLQTVALAYVSRSVANESYLPLVATAGALVAWMIASIRSLGAATTGVDGSTGELMTALSAVTICGATAVVAGWISRTLPTSWLRPGVVAGCTAWAIDGLIIGASDLAFVEAPVFVAAWALVMTSGVYAARRFRPGGAAIVTGALATAAAVYQLDDIARCLLEPLSWATEPWEMAGSANIQSMLELPQPRQIAMLALLCMLTAATALVTGIYTQRNATAAHIATSLAGTAVYLGALSVSNDITTVITLLTAIALALAFGAKAARIDRFFKKLLFGTGLAFAAEALLWSLGNETATLCVLAALFGAAASFAFIHPSRRPIASAATLALGLCWFAALCASLDFEAAEVGFTVAVIALSVMVLLGRNETTTSNYLFRTSVVGTGASLTITMTDATWFALGLLMAAGATAIVAMAPRRRSLGWLAASLSIASLWVRLAAGGIHVAEAYTVPVALVVLFAGWRRTSVHPDTPSWTAYGTGLSIAFGPTVLLLPTGEGLTRPVLLAFAALAVMLYGASRRMKAPLVIGALALLADAVVQFGPYVNHVPRWITIGFVGSVLIIVGATYEQRRRDAEALRDRYDEFR